MDLVSIHKLSLEMFGSVDILGQSYRSPFMSQTVSGQTRNTCNDPSAPQIFGSTTPFGPQTGSPIFGVTSNGVSAAAQSSTPFPSSTTFGASFSTDFGNTMSTFGASSTPAFSSSSSPSIVGFWLFVPFGSTCTPAFGSDSMPAFGATSIPAFSGTSPFGSTTQPSHPAFGSSIFGSSTPFGGSSQPPFGATSSAALRSTTSPPFRRTEAATGVSSSPGIGTALGFYISSTPASGSSSSTFGTSSNPTSAVSITPGFGSTTQPSHPTFGSSIFGSSTPFGGSSQPPFGATSSAALRSTTSFPFRSTEAATGVSSFPSVGSGHGFYVSSTPASCSSSSLFALQAILLLLLQIPGFTCGCTAATGVSSFPSVGSGHGFYVSRNPASGSSSSTFATSSNPTSAVSNTPGFGSTTQPSHPAFGSSIFGSSTPFGGSSQPPFGATSSAALRSTTKFPFRSTEAATGVSSSPGFGPALGFYISSTPASGSSSSIFGTSSNPTSATSSTPGFTCGSTEAATGVSSFPSVGSGHGFYVSSTPASCSSSSLFRTSSNPTSAASNTPGFTCGCTAATGVSSFPSVGSGHGFYVSSTPASGSSSSTFGTSSNPTSAVSNTPGFGSTTQPSHPAFGKSTITFPSSQFGPSCPSGAQSSPFGAQSKTFGNTAFRISASGGQRWGSRVPPYTPTEPDDCVGLETRGDLQSISAMPIYGDKTHEELRWQDYQLGDRGGPVPAGGSCFPLSTSNILNPAPTFAQTSSSLFNTSTPSNIFAPEIPSFSFTGSRTSSIPFTSSTFPLSTSSSLFTTSSSSPSVFRQASSPSLFSSSAPSNPAPRTDSTSNSGLFNSPFGVQSTTCGNTACGISASGGQFGGSRVAPYTKTAGPDGGSLSGLYQSICGMRIYGDKSHEELRWQDYQLGDRGGRALVGGNCFDLSTTQSNVLNPAPAFIQTSSSRLNTSTLPNIIAPQIPAFTPTPFGASFTPLISPNLFIPSASSFYVPGQISSPSLFSSSATPTSTVAFPAPAPTTSTFNSSPINHLSSIAQTGGTAGLTTTSSGGLFTIPSGNTHISHEERFPLEEKRRLRIKIARSNREKNGQNSPFSSVLSWP
ncbi:nuclear pore complex protein NUP98A [Prunus yedoensis var. nudiflora]|uniref:Nuclear pore complex protein NUP98A n=1 Tax=Prunus yedoensis var. nudiflora TaxID=2094558 RepID=A0A314XQQ7_PRUYE|nr:nuclear pore complex protein NUP98A [Prunus yedoensis var. nudiflora]